MAPAAALGDRARGAVHGRRGLLRAGLAGAGALAAGSALGACGSAMARLTRAATQPVVLRWQPWADFPPTVSPSAVTSTLSSLLERWLAANPGVEVNVIAPGDDQATATSMVNGRGPDVFHGTALPPFVQQGLVLDLGPYVRRTAVDLSIFASGQMAYLQAAGAGAAAGALYGLPATLQPLAMAVDQGALDQLGLTYPQSDWTAQQWAGMWRGATDLAARRYGGMLDWSGYDGAGGGPAPFYLRGFGGGYVDPADPTRCALNDPGSLAGLRWCYDLVLGRFCQAGGDVAAQVQGGSLTSAPLGTAGELSVAATTWGGKKWHLYPMPVWPNGSRSQGPGTLTLGSSDFYGVWAGTSAPDVAWSLLHYLCVQPDWQRLMIQVAWAGPNQPSLWPEWQALVTATWAPMGAAGLQVYVQAVQGDGIYVGLPFRYDELATRQVLGGLGTQLQSGQVSVAAAAASAAGRIDSLQTAAAQRAAAAAAAQAKLRQEAAAGSAAGGQTVG